MNPAQRYRFPIAQFDNVFWVVIWNMSLLPPTFACFIREVMACEPQKLYKLDKIKETGKEKHRGQERESPNESEHLNSSLNAHS